LDWAKIKPPSSSDPLRNWELQQNYESGSLVIPTIIFAADVVGFGGSSGALAAPEAEIPATTEGAVLFAARDEAVTLTNKIITQELEQNSITLSRVPTRYGTVVDAITKTNVRQAVAEGQLPSTFRTSPTVGLNRGWERSSYRAPDIWDTATGQSWDVMTPNSNYFYQHESKYLGVTLPDGTLIQEINPLFYFRLLATPW
jgi:hypothetical protein